jgi:hypothetical protein
VTNENHLDFSVDYACERGDDSLPLSVADASWDALRP